MMTAIHSGDDAKVKHGDYNNQSDPNLSRSVENARVPIFLLHKLHRVYQLFYFFSKYSIVNDTSKRKKCLWFSKSSTNFSRKVSKIWIIIYTSKYAFV